MPTAHGPARLLLSPAEHPAALLLLGHGAGGGPDAADLALLARTLPAAGVSVGRFEQPWRTAGRRVAVRPPLLDQAWLELADHLRAEPATGALPWLVGGRSAGARVACRTASAVGARAVVCLAFPLHLPGRPERSRAPELLTPSVPRLVLQGSRDTFGTDAEVRAAAADDPGVRVITLPGADHGFRLPAASAFTPAQLRATLAAEVGALAAEVLAAGAETGGE